MDIKLQPLHGRDSIFLSFIKAFHSILVMITEDLLTKKTKIQATSSVRLTEIAQVRGLLCEMQLRSFSQNLQWWWVTSFSVDRPRNPEREARRAGFPAPGWIWALAARCSLQLCRHTLGWIHLLSLLLSGFDRAVLVMTEQFCFRSF